MALLPRSLATEDMLAESGLLLEEIDESFKIEGDLFLVGETREQNQAIGVPPERLRRLRWKEIYFGVSSSNPVKR